MGVDRYFYNIAGFLAVSRPLVLCLLFCLIGVTPGLVKAQEDCVREEDPVIQPGPLLGPLRLAPAPEAGYLVVDSRGGKIFHFTAQSPEATVLLFAAQGFPLSVATIEKNNKTQYLVGNDTERTIDLYKTVAKGVMPQKMWFHKEPVQALDIVASGANDKVYVVDGLGKQVIIFDDKGKRLGSFGPQLVDPKAVAVDDTVSELVVSDYGDPLAGIDATLKVFALDGTHQQTITGNFSRPQGVAYVGGRIFVADAMLGEVLEFDRATGGFTVSYGCFGSSPGHLLVPMDVVADPAGQALYVADNRNGRITVLSLDGQ